MLGLMYFITIAGILGKVVFIVWNWENKKQRAAPDIWNLTWHPYLDGVILLDMNNATEHQSDRVTLRPR